MPQTKPALQGHFDVRLVRIEYLGLEPVGNEAALRCSLADSDGRTSDVVVLATPDAMIGLGAAIEEHAAQVAQLHAGRMQ